MAATPVEWKGDAKVFDGVTMQMYPVGCFEYGCASCCSNALFCSLTYGTHLCCGPPTFTFHIAEDGMSGYGGEATFAGRFPMSPIPCFNGCGFGPLAFVSPFKFEEVEGSPGALKWVGNGQVCKGGMCPCLNNKGDYGINDANGDGSTPEKAHQAYPVSMFWPPCVNGTCCGKGVPAFRLTQKGVGPPNVPKGVTMTRGD